MPLMRKWLPAGVFILLAGCGGSSSSPRRCSIALLPISATASSSTGQAINSAGDVAGRIDGVAAVWTGGVATQIGPKGRNTTATAISDNGYVAGVDIDENTGIRKPFVWKNGATVQIPIPIQSPSYLDVAAVNNAGDVCGYVQSSGGAGQAFWYHKGALTILPELPGGGSAAFGMDNAGNIVGVSAGHAVIWENGKIRDLGHGSGGASAIASSGAIAGYDDNGMFILSGRNRRDIGFNDRSVFPTSINRSEVIVGTYSPYSNIESPSFPFVVSQRGFSDLIPLTDGLPAAASLSVCRINDDGTIVGTITEPITQVGGLFTPQRAVILVPQR